MTTGSFMDIIGVHYKDIKNLFTSRDVKNGIRFNEDSFNTAFIKCVEQFGDKIVEYDDVVKYFYVTYKHIRDTELTYYSKITVQDEFEDDIIDDEDEDYAKYVYETVMLAVSNTFGEDDMMMYSLYKYHDWTKEELENDGYDCIDFDERINTIHRFMKKFCKKNIRRAP
jgi:hypothetical protein